MAVAAGSTLSNISVTDRNTDIPFFPNITYNLLNDDYGVIDPVRIPTFSWIQAFYDSAPTGLTVAPTICVYTGNLDENDDPILSQVRFAYSGERINIKGMGIFSTGKNWRGQTVTSVPIGASTTLNLLQVIAYGGMR